MRRIPPPNWPTSGRCRSSPPCLPSSPLRRAFSRRRKAPANRARSAPLRQRRRAIRRWSAKPSPTGPFVLSLSKGGEWQRVRGSTSSPRTNLWYTGLFSWLPLPPADVQKLDRFARYAHVGDMIAHRRFDFEPAVAGGDLDLAGGAEKAVADHPGCEDILARRGARDLDALGPHEEPQRAAGGVSVRGRGEPADRRLDGFGVDHLGVEQIGAADEAGDERVRRGVVDLLRRAGLHEAAVAQKNDAVGERERLVLIVSDEERGDVAAALDATDLVAHGHARGRVERRERLVQKQRARAEHERARQRDALLLPAGEPRRQAIGEPGEPHELEHFCGAPAALVESHVAHA